MFLPLRKRAQAVDDVSIINCLQQEIFTVAVLPFLADPTRFMVSKPEIFRQIAARMDVELSPSTTVKWDSYARVLDVSRQLQSRLAPLGASDFIDVQTFVWVTRHLK